MRIFIKLWIPSFNIFHSKTTYLLERTALLKMCHVTLSGAKSYTCWYTGDCRVTLPLWQTDSWPPAQHSEAPREQQSSSAGRSGTPAHKQWDTHDPKTNVHEILVMTLLYLLIKDVVAAQQETTDNRQRESKWEKTVGRDTKEQQSVKSLSQDGGKKTDTEPDVALNKTTCLSQHQ